MRSTLVLLAGAEFAGEPVCIDELTGRTRGARVSFTAGAEGSTWVISAGGVQQDHLRFEWDPTNCTWRVENRGPTGSVFVNRNILKEGDRVPLRDGYRIRCGDARIRFASQPDAPTLNGGAELEFPIGPEGLVIGRGEQKEPGGPPRLCLDPEIMAISSKQAEVARKGDSYLLINHNKIRRTMLNGENITERELVFGDSVQIPDYDYYTFQFNGASLVHIGERGVLQARGLNRRAAGKRILADVNLDLRCGEFLGVLGGSGQGKSTLMNSLCGIVPADEGEVKLDGIPLKDPREMSKVGIGYVPQDDIVHRELTIRTALIYAAELRLALPRQQIEAAVEGALKMLHLYEHQMKPVRVVSGGQRKRVSIASELITSPRFLFLDEPTSGLDPETEKELMAELYSLRMTKGMGILCTTHVLRSSKFFSSIIFVQGGRIIFNGPTWDAARYFLEGESSRTHAGDTHSAESRDSGGGSSSNSETELMEMLPIVFNRVQDEVAERTESIKHEVESGAPATGESIPERVAREMETEFKESKFATPLSVVRNERTPKAPAHTFIKRPGFIKVLWTLLKRQWSLLVSDPLNYLFLLAQAVIIGALVGWVSDNIVFQMFIAVIATLWFGCSNGAQEIVGELAIFQREHLAGVGKNAYLVSKFTFLTAVTAMQAMLLYITILCVHHVFHHEVLPTADSYDPVKERAAYTQLFFDNNPDLLRPPPPQPAPTPVPASDQSSGQTAAPVSTNPADFDLATPTPTPGQAAAPETPEAPESTLSLTGDEPQLVYVNPTGLTAVNWQYGLMEGLAWFFRVKDNMLDELGVHEVETQPGSPAPEQKHESWVGFMALLLGMRIGALLMAAVTGVAIGLTVSAYVRSVTQAVMWVPLILIPQILFGGFVVTTPEMDKAVAVFSSILPSYNLEHLMDVTNVLGCKVPRMTNKTKIPAFFSAPPYDSEAVRFTDENGAEEEEYDKLSEKTKSWENLLVWRDRIGMRHKAPQGDSVESRRDVLVETGDTPDLSNEGMISWLVLGGWVVGCYLAVLYGLSRRETG